MLDNIRPHCRVNHGVCEYLALFADTYTRRFRHAVRIVVSFSTWRVCTARAGTLDDTCVSGTKRDKIPRMLIIKKMIENSTPKAPSKIL